MLNADTLSTEFQADIFFKQEMNGMSKLVDLNSLLSNRYFNSSDLVDFISQSVSRVKCFYPSL